MNPRCRFCALGKSRSYCLYFSVDETLFAQLTSLTLLHSLKKYDGYEDPIKTKEELMFHVGFRQFVARLVKFVHVSFTAIAFLVCNLL